MHFRYAPGAYLPYAPGALCIQICPWSIFDLEYYSRLFMLLEQLLQEQLFLEQLLLEHNLGPKSHKSFQVGPGQGMSYFFPIFFLAFPNFSSMVIIIPY